MAISKVNGLGLLEAALSYAANGWPVIPLHDCAWGRCSCTRNCSSPGKHPRTRQGHKDATTDENIIQQWWERWPNANIGLRTGAESGIVVLDVDPDHGGEKSLENLVKCFGGLSETIMANTGGGGSHYFFQHPGSYTRNSQGRLGKGLDIRGDGGYIVAAPSRHQSGCIYQFDNPDIKLSALPEWLLSLLLSDGKAKPPENSSLILSGCRNAELTSLAGRLRRQGAGYAEILQELIQKNDFSCQQPLTRCELKKITASIMNYPIQLLLFRWRDCWRSEEGPDCSGVRHVLWALSGYMDTRTGVCFPTQDQLSRDTRFTRKTIRKYLDEAERLGWIRRERVSTRQGSWNYRYFASFPDE
ncbi:bifunctional DNA primase/polymerase [Amphritea sp. HPY]|uniref:bifunctional DNA primase/polymerase n=1 Tax=Amphritea sp. HPY TaxID=3421652 RepID=UPI003D7E97A1